MCSWGFVNILTLKLGFKKSSFSWVYAPKFQPVGDLVKTGIQKVKFKSSLCTQISPAGDCSSKVEFWNPSFQPDLVKTGIQKVEFKLSFFTQISPNWWLEFKSGVKVKLKWSFKNQVLTLTWQKLGFKKFSLSQVFSPRFHPACALVKTGVQKVEFM